MKINYHLPLLTFEEQVSNQYILLDELEKQCWFSIVVIGMFNREELICAQ
ncbi:MAG TPA: hypothetical protein VKS81_04840 [Bacteroidota bacterium]|nr:hypothetical protein [Bacteroidota bacterium]